MHCTICSWRHTNAYWFGALWRWAADQSEQSLHRLADDRPSYRKQARDRNSRLLRRAQEIDEERGTVKMGKRERRDERKDTNLIHNKIVSFHVPAIKSVFPWKAIFSGCAFEYPSISLPAPAQVTFQLFASLQHRSLREVFHHFPENFPYIAV